MLLDELERAVGYKLDIRDLIVVVSQIPYGRTSEQSALSVVREWRGTCSTKHLLLRDALAERWPHVRVDLCHRPYVVTRPLAAALWGSEVAFHVPPDGLADVHTFARVTLDGRLVDVDVTNPLEGWDGASDIELQCGHGEDVPAGLDPIATKRLLVESHCDALVREPFIEELTVAHDRTRQGV